ncbi:MAG: glucose-1-phosphate cytidylyltransferase, partial [Lachnospiraceae bacterium]|nr:glucose-1-phosphate cytidylyltransferase [Lachnospiraceae bacterium]
MIKEYFNDYFLHSSDVEFNLSDGSVKFLNGKAEDWKVTLVDTGLNTMTGGRIKRVKDYIDGDTFMLTYGDGVCNVDLKKELDFHKKHGKLLTLTTVSIAQQKGVMEFDKDGLVTAFREKALMDRAIINGGYMVVDKKIMDYIDGDDISLEKEPFERLVKEGQMMSFMHEGFWQCMDTQREMKYLCELWENDKAPWKIW